MVRKVPDQPAFTGTQCAAEVIGCVAESLYRCTYLPRSFGIDPRRIVQSHRHRAGGKPQFARYIFKSYHKIPVQLMRIYLIVSSTCYKYNPEYFSCQGVKCQIPQVFRIFIIAVYHSGVLISGHISNIASTALLTSLSPMRGSNCCILAS